MSDDNLSGKEFLKMLSRSCCRPNGKDGVGAVSAGARAFTFCGFDGAFLGGLCKFLDIGGPIVVGLKAVKVLLCEGVGSR